MNLNFKKEKQLFVLLLLVVQRIEVTSKDRITSTFYTIHFFIDYYVAFMAQSSLMTCTILYFLPSYILARCLDKFINDMYRVGIMFDGE